MPPKEKAEKKKRETEEAEADVPEVEAQSDQEEPQGGGDADAGGKRKRKRQRTRKPKAGKDDEAGAEPKKLANAPAKEVTPAVEGTVYVEGISYDAEDADVKTMFDQIGSVVELRMPRWHDSNKPRGFAHVVFKDSAHVPIAIAQLNGQRLMGRYLTVALPRAPKSVPSAPSVPPPEGCNTLFVKNLPYDCTEEAVRKVMVTFGDVKDVRLAAATNKDGDTRLKGFGYVQFASEVGTKRAAAAAREGTLAVGKIGYVSKMICRRPNSVTLSRWASAVCGLRRSRSKAEGVVQANGWEALGREVGSIKGHSIT